MKHIILISFLSSTLGYAMQPLAPLPLFLSTNKGIQRYSRTRSANSPRMKWLLTVLENDPDNKIFSPRPLSILLLKDRE